MKCVVGNVNLGTWCRAIHSLTQVGDEDIYFDFSDTILTVSTANASQTSFATFLFFKPFFTNYQMTSREPEQIVIPSKIILKPYKTLRVAKTYITSELSYQPNEDFMTVTSEARSQASVTYKLVSSAQKEELVLDCDPYALKNCLKADSKVLSSCLSNFSHVKGLAEITLKIQGNKVTLRNCVTDTARKDGSVVTEYYLSAHDFTEFECEDESTELTFGFREFKVFASFAEQLKIPVCIHFQDKDNPVVITVRTDTFEARLCMATRMSDPFTSMSSSAQSTPLSAGTNGRISNFTSQGSSTSESSRNVPSQEVHRQQTNATPVVPVEIAVTEPPPAKRMRRTEAASPVPPSSPEPMLPVDEEPCGDTNNLIAPYVEKIAQRTKSVAYRTIHKFANAPTMTEKEYLETIPGHDEILCPGSDEDEGSDGSL